MLFEDLTGEIINACLGVMKELGAGFLESVYQNAVQISLLEKGLIVIPQKQYPVVFHGKSVGSFYADFVVEDKVILELKAVERLIPENQAQVINYLKASGLDVGLLVNFGRQHLEFRRLYRPDLKTQTTTH